MAGRHSFRAGGTQGREGLVSAAGPLLRSRPPHTAHKLAVTLQLIPSASFSPHGPAAALGWRGWDGEACEVCVSEELEGAQSCIQMGVVSLRPPARAER